MAAGVRHHEIGPGENSFEYLSTTHYGDATGAGLIKASNPGVLDPPPVGITVIIPDRPPLTPTIYPGSADAKPDDVEVWIDGSRFRFWSEVTITKTFDAVSTVEFTAPQADTAAFRAAFAPLSFKDMVVLVGGKPQFVGTLLKPKAATDPNRGPSMTVSGYSRPGVLADCTMPSSAFPLQFKKVSLAVIAQRLSETFSIIVDVDGDIGGVFRRVRIKSMQRPLAFLTGLAKQRKVVLSSTPEGHLLLRGPPVVSEPVATIREGVPPFVSASIDTNPQAFYSHLTVMRKKAKRVTSTSHTVINEAVPGVLRPMTVQSEDTNSPAELPAAAESLAGRMLAGAVTWTLKVNTWRNGNVEAGGELWEEGSTVNLLAPSAGILKPTDLIVRSVKGTRKETESEAELELVLPGAFSGELPDDFPWQE